MNYTYDDIKAIQKVGDGRSLLLCSDWLELRKLVETYSHCSCQYCRSGHRTCFDVGVPCPEAKKLKAENEQLRKENKKGEDHGSV